MKKGLITILAFLYLGLAGGVVVNFHYCMGQLSSIEYGYDEHDQCGKCGMKEKKGCCNTEFKMVKLQDSHQWAKSASVVNKSFTIFTDLIYQPSSSILIRSLEITSGYHPPPNLRTNKVYLHTGIFRI
ncbi:MAG: hypothetical protein H7122_06070 [Chitinophagaceae bacterium]|nr:hypothetical protein [Chitinophagaceae bacterium]